MIVHRPFDTLGCIERDWLRARLHFRFDAIGRPEHTPLGPLHIWNDDTFAPHSGFGMHAHENVEIVTFVCSGAITHEDSFGNAGRIAAGNVQVMSAGTGVLHAERNEEDEPTRLFQIWLSPRSRDGKPRWAMRRSNPDDADGRLIVLASGNTDDVKAGALAIDADARALYASVSAGRTLKRVLSVDAALYLVATSRVWLNDIRLAPGDGASIVGETVLTVTAIDDTSVVMVELLAA